jgi:hypothetical protein
LKVSPRRGRKPKARQTRPTVEANRPKALAIERRLQGVTPVGIASRVRVTSAATGLCDNPASRSAADRSRQLPTM